MNIGGVRMIDKEALAKKIFIECEKEGEPVTMEEALEMAKMEINASSKRQYEQSAKPRKSSTKERKVDTTKKRFLDCFQTCIENCGGTITFTKNEAEFSFTFEGESYTVKLVKHRPSKK
jgi:hypothetical protein